MNRLLARWHSMLKNYLKTVALLILNIPFSIGLLIILEKRLEFDTPGYWLAKSVFVMGRGKDFGPMAWTSLGIDFVLCFAAVWMISLLFLKLIHEVERQGE